jgi:phosphoesterase RecJ-like protein
MQIGLKNLDRYLSQNDNFIITAHSSPDGDALGSEIAFKEFLTKIGKKSFIVNSDPSDEIYDFIDFDKEIKVWDEGLKLKLKLDKYNFFFLDVNNSKNIGSLESYFNLSTHNLFIIDHHLAEEKLQLKNFIRPEVPAASQLIYEIFDYYQIPLSFKSAQAIYAGILFDTGSFHFPKTSSRTFEIASKCLEYKVDPFFVYEQLWSQNSLTSFALQNKVMAGMQLLANNRLALIKLTPEMLVETKAKYEEAQNFINIPLSLKTVKACAFIKFNPEKQEIRVGLRSKGDLDVAQIASKYKGGGHKNAAGFRSDLSFEETCQIISRDMENLFV